MFVSSCSVCGKKKNQNSLKLRSEWIFGEISGQNFIM